LRDHSAKTCCDYFEDYIIIIRTMTSLPEDEELKPSQKIMRYLRVGLRRSQKR